MQRARVLLTTVALCGIAAACADHPDPVSSRTPARPRLDTRAASVDVTAYQSLATADGNWTRAIQTAVNAASVVHFPAGTYNVNGSVTLPAFTRVYGDGASSVISQAASASVFVAAGSSSAFVDSLTVDHLAFQGPHGWYALDVKTARHVSFTDNRATNMGLVHVSTHLPINVWDGTADPAATAGLTSESQLSSDIKVLRSRGTGDYVVGTANGTSGAVFVQYAADVTISDDTLSNYAHGIEWWGGDADPTRGGVSTNPRWLRRLSVANSSVKNVEAGIWGGMGQSVTVSGSYVENCADVCLDDEGGVDVTFTGNQARNAGTAVLSVFNYARRVTFSGNDVRSDGGLGSTLFWSSNVQQLPDSIDITLQGNTFTYTAASGVGHISRSAARLFKLQSNTLSNVVLTLDPGNNGGGDQLLSNTLSFDRSTNGGPAISVGHNYGAWGASGYTVQVNGNRVMSTVSQDTARGISIYEIGVATNGCVTVSGDTVQSFGRWLKIRAESSSNPCFSATNNRYNGVTDGSIDTSGSPATPNLTQSGNAALTVGGFSAAISGNAAPRSNSSQTYYAVPANGTAPYTYQWYKNGVAQVGKTASSYTFTVGTSSFTLQVRVKDATNAIVYSDEMSVTPCASCSL